MDKNNVDNSHSVTQSSSSSSSSSNNPVVDEAEGIWSADIEQSFLEALAIYPPCGRRKIILTEEGKMYGRNELVARYIKIRTGKTRTRKQVSSHLQVLAKRRSKELQLLRNDKEAQKLILERLKQYTSAEIVSMETDKIDIDEHSNSDDNAEQNRKLKPSPIKNLLQTSTSISNSVKQIQAPLSINNDHTKVNDDAPIKLQTKTTSVERMIPIQQKNVPLPNMTNNSAQYYLPTSPIVYQCERARSRCSSNASSSSPLSSGSTTSQSALIMNQLIHSTVVIGDENFRLQHLSTSVEVKRIMPSTHPSLTYPTPEEHSTYQYDLLRLNANDIQMKNIRTFETISIDQIFDKFSHHDGLKDLYERNPDRPFFLIKFWADTSLTSPSFTNSMNVRDATFFTSFTYTSSFSRPIRTFTRLCSFGKKVLEKIDTSERPQRDQYDQYIYRFDRSPLCEYMVQFIQKLRSLPNTMMMNSVLENFTVLQVIKFADDPDRVLLCLAFVFEIPMCDSGGPQYQVYRLVAN